MRRLSSGRIRDDDDPTVEQLGEAINRYRSDISHDVHG